MKKASISLFDKKNKSWNPFAKRERYEDYVNMIPWQYVLPAAAGVAGGMYLGSSIGPGLAKSINNFAFGSPVLGQHAFSGPSPQNAAYFRQFQ